MKGVMNLIWLPIQQYQEDGRVLWGMRRGADSFLTSSGFAMAELTTKLINLLQVGVTNASWYSQDPYREGTMYVLAITTKFKPTINL